MKDNGHSSAMALLPFLVFIVVFLGSGIALDNFYALPATVAALCGIIVAFLLPQNSFKEKINHFIKGCGDTNILTMCIIYLLAGAFATLAKAIGSIDAVVSLGMQYLSPQYIPVGVFLMASFLSVSAGTSVGTIVALSPIVFGLAENIGVDMSLVGASLLCGAMFGDNLSFISDTTIAATQTMGCEMKDKFKENIKVALPASILAMLIFIYLGSQISVNDVANVEVKDFSISLIMPYLAVILLSILGGNVFLVLMIGILLSGAVGLGNGLLSWLDFANKIYDGFASMNDIFLLSLFTGGLAGIVENLGGINYLLNKVKSIISGQKSAYLGIGGLVGLSDMAIANNTIAIVLTGRVAGKVKEEYGLNAKFTAAVLDIFSCIAQGLIPYGAQILILIELSGNKVDYWGLLQNAWYIYFLLIFVIVKILIKKPK